MLSSGTLRILFSALSRETIAKRSATVSENLLGNKLAATMEPFALKIPENEHDLQGGERILGMFNKSLTFREAMTRMSADWDYFFNSEGVAESLLLGESFVV